MGNVQAEIVTTAKQRREFIDYPKRLYREAAQWVPPFDLDMRKLITRKHPYFEHSPGEFFLFKSGGRTVGRVVALANDLYNEEHGVKCAHFYFADFEDDESAGRVLFDTVAKWARDRGMETVIGPLFSGATMGGGVLVEGFEHRAAMNMMVFNYDYYARHYEAAGFSKRFDLLSLSADPHGFQLPDRIESIADMVRSRGRLVVSQMKNKRALRQVADEIGALYNPTLADHTENYPLTDKELAALKSDLLLIAKPDLEKIIRYDGEIVGYILSFPDLSAAMQRNRGKLGPIRILRLLTESKKTRKIIFNGMGILEKYQRIGGNALLYSELTKSTTGSEKYSFDDAEMCQVNESTDLMLKDLLTVGASVFKRHRVYERTTG
ncbi:MAG: hypothetical protein KAU31_03195 [Spirochaetaceae bacterium]|nr:hypothetical protein [Spirochaetaceae bacterium]